MDEEKCSYFRRSNQTEFDPGDVWCVHPDSESGDCIDEFCPLHKKWLGQFKDTKLRIEFGNFYSYGWSNIDMNKERVRAIPYNDGEVSYILLERVLEYLPYHHTVELMRECYRVLKTGGVVRILASGYWYDEDRLPELLEIAGFGGMVKCRFNSSEHEPLIGIDRIQDSLIMEATK
jgi:hypothetical protein